MSELFFIRSVYKIFRFNLKNPVAALRVMRAGSFIAFVLNRVMKFYVSPLRRTGSLANPSDPFPLFQKILTSTAFMGVGHKVHETPSPV